ncbi:hypothetical protein CAPN006_12410 [Capnocytophaga canimorsus]|nr:hypothetical protein CAPN006_12410 [Capnocytophaga canimorsus]
MKNPHEIMHALGLEHTFAEDTKKDQNKKHIFNKGGTRNYMDYDNNKEYTQKWQWELMRKSKYIKLLILFFSLFLSSCKTMSYQEIQKISCDYEILIPKGERKIEIPFKGEKYYEINNDSIYRGINEYLHDPNIRFSVFTNYRKMGIKSYTQYHFDGNIFSKIFFYSSSNIDEGFQTLKIYYFDVDGNIVKKENNDNWNICAFQALAIAKKRIKEKKRGEWFLEKSIFKNEKCWQVSYYYKRKYKIFFVDKDTGEILKINKV